MYCRRCNYPLAKLTENRCPECGGQFDPSDPRTYATATTAPISANLFRLATSLSLAGAVLTFGTLLFMTVNSWPGMDHMPTILTDVVIWLAPYAILAWIALIGIRKRAPIATAVVVFCGSLLILANGMTLIVSVMTVDLVSTAGTGVAFMPLLQLVLAIIIAGVAMFGMPPSAKYPRSAE